MHDCFSSRDAEPPSAQLPAIVTDSTPPDAIAVRFSPRNLVLIPLVLAFAIGLTALILPVLASPEAWEAFQNRGSGRRGNWVRDMTYPVGVLFFGGFAAITLLGATVSSILHLLRVFGPPALEIDVQGRGIYRLPWRTTRFTIQPSTRFEIGPGFRFDPPITTDDGRSLRAINLRPQMTDLGPARIRARLKAMQPDWHVED